MTWFAAYIISYVKFLDGIQDKYPIWENIVLIEAASVQEAMAKADQIGREFYEDGEDRKNGFTWEDRPGQWVYAGFRKLIECRINYGAFGSADAVRAISIDDWSAPIDGTEITYSQLEVTTPEDLKRLVDGEPVVVSYEE